MHDATSHSALPNLNFLVAALFWAPVSVQGVGLTYAQSDAKGNRSFRSAPGPSMRQRLQSSQQPAKPWVGSHSQSLPAFGSFAALLTHVYGFSQHAGWSAKLTSSFQAPMR